MPATARSWWRRMLWSTLRRWRALAPKAALVARTSGPIGEGRGAASMRPAALRSAAPSGRPSVHVESHCGPAEPEDGWTEQDCSPSGAEAWHAPVAVTIRPVDWSRLVPRPQAGIQDRLLATASDAQR